MRGAYILNINGSKINNKKDVKDTIEAILPGESIEVMMGTIDRMAMHPDEGVPIMYFDQLNMIAHHQRQIKYGKEMVPDINDG